MSQSNEKIESIIPFNTGKKRQHESLIKLHVTDNHQSPELALEEQCFERLKQDEKFFRDFLKNLGLKDNPDLVKISLLPMQTEEDINEGKPCEPVHFEYLDSKDPNYKNNVMKLEKRKKEEHLRMKVQRYHSFMSEYCESMAGVHAAVSGLSEIRLAVDSLNCGDFRSALLHSLNASSCKPIVLIADMEPQWHAGKSRTTPAQQARSLNTDAMKKIAQIERLNLLQETPSLSTNRIAQIIASSHSEDWGVKAETIRGWFK